MKTIEQYILERADGDPRRPSVLIGVEHGIDLGTWYVERGDDGAPPNVARSFSGQYTLAEVRALLADMERVQSNINANYYWE